MRCGVRGGVRCGVRGSVARLDLDELGEDIGHRCVGLEREVEAGALELPEDLVRGRVGVRVRVRVGVRVRGGGGVKVRDGVRDTVRVRDKVRVRGGN